MTKPWFDWLPDSAFDNQVLRNSITETVDCWAELWLGKRRPTPHDKVNFVAERRTALGGLWTEIAENAWLQWSEPTQLAYAGLALDRPHKNSLNSDGDKQLMLLLAQRMARELGNDLRALLNCGEANGRQTPSRGLQLTWSRPIGAPALELLFGYPALTKLRRQQCPPRRTSSAPELRIVDALGDLKIDVEAVLGSARLTVLDLRDIAVGDVVVVDRPTNSAIELRLAGSPRLLAKALLVHDGGELALRAKQD